jgi:MEMO1 family protein
MKRKPYVAGQFYPDDPAILRTMIGGLVEPDAAKARAIAVVSPHAGYVYSGGVAGAVFSVVKIPGTAVILGPSHRGIQSLAAVQRSGEWATPLGDIPIATDLADAILERSRIAEDDPGAHLREHSIEVQIPFLRFFRKDLSIVPICVSSGTAEKDLADLGGAVAGAVAALGRDVLVVASTDMSHYVGREEAWEQDHAAIDRILALDPGGLFRTVMDRDISMCGFQPVTAALYAAKGLGAVGAELVRYSTSGDVTGDDREVVGYAGIRIL